MKLNKPKSLIKLTFLFSIVFLSGYSQNSKELKTIDNGIAQIEKTYDDFEDETTWKSPILKNVVFYKYKDKNGEMTNYLVLRTKGLTLNIGEKGLMVIFEDGTRFEKANAEVDYDSSSGAGWDYKVFIRINDDELSLFAEKKIKAYRLYIYDGNLSEKDKLLAMGWAKGIINSN